MGSLRQRDGKQSRLESVVAKDVGEARADHGAKTEIEQRPRRVLARGTAAEVVARQQYRRTERIRGVQRKVGARTSVVVHTPIGEQMRAESATLDRFEEARRDDLVGVDVRRRQHHASRSERREWLDRRL